MVHLQQNDEYLALDRFFQYLFGMDDNIIRNYLLSADYDGIDPQFLQTYYGGHENYMDRFLARTIRASKITDEVDIFVQGQLEKVPNPAKEGFRHLEEAFIAHHLYQPAQVQQNALLTSDSSNDEDDEW